MIYLEEKYPPPSTDSLHGDKVINVFSQQNFAISKSDTRDCHILGKINPKNTIERFTNCKFYNEALNKMKDLKKSIRLCCVLHQILLSILVKPNTFSLGM